MGLMRTYRHVRMQNTDIFASVELCKDLAFPGRCVFSENPQGFICMHCKDDMIEDISRAVGDLQIDSSIPLAFATPNRGSEMNVMIAWYCSQEGIDIRLGAMFNSAPVEALGDSIEEAMLGPT